MEFLILFVPIVWLFSSRYWLKSTVSISEIVIGMVLITGVATTSYYSTLDAMVVDYELWNGQVEKKEKIKAGCSHSYNCNCTSTGSNGSSRCSTCYKHDYDWSWILETTAGRIYIDRIDSRGLRTPPNWEKAYISEPVTRIVEYTNYIKAVPSTVYNNPEYQTSQPYQGVIPEYPLDLQTEYSFEHVSAYDVQVEDLPEESLKVIGPQKQVNVMLLMVNADDKAYMAALEKAWLRGKRNDVIIVTGSRGYPEIDWVQVMSWGPSKAFKTELETAISDIGTLRADVIVPIIEKHVLSSFERLQMEDYKYLEDEINVSGGNLWWLLGVLIIGPMLYTLLAHRYNISIAAFPFALLASLFVLDLAMGVFGHIVALLGYLLIVVITVLLSVYVLKRRNARAKVQNKVSEK